jgi:BirA family biotin operon repressor/biotin-[acetyl-CoA-carboxylase] ligase
MLKARALEGENAGLVICAVSQTKGRGTHERSFHSPCGGLYFSVLLRPDASAADNLALTTFAGEVICGAIRELTGKPVYIKPVNDILLDGKKLCGILTESRLTPEGAADYVIIGAGINLLKPENGFPEELREIAGALCEDSAEAAKLREPLLRRIAEQLCAARQAPLPRE